MTDHSRLTHGEAVRRHADVSLRSGDEFMSAERVASAYPHALSFPRLTVAVLREGRWQLEKLRFSIDAKGEGEALYRFSSGSHRLYYFVLSNAYPESEKTDHNTGDKWDVLSALCQGEWSHEREKIIRRELAKQRSGRPDYDTLIYARANRSGRLFDHVVNSLALGRQPDGRRLSRVGYIARTTSFAGNGLLGMRQFSGYGEAHPLRRPYHAQMCAALLLREFVYDLVDHMAAARGGDAAVPLDIDLKRYLGIGNSAASGLVYFVASHPRMMQRWGENLEHALREVRERRVDPGDAAVARFSELLDRACRYLSECQQDDNEVFADPNAVRKELAQFASDTSELIAKAKPPDLWMQVETRARSQLSLAAREILNAVFLELYDDIQFTYLEKFWVDEELRTQPEMTLGELASVIDKSYGWMKDAETGDHHYFWYRSEDAPGDPRRGIRGKVPEIEFETPLDLSLKMEAIKTALAERDGKSLVGELLLERPDLYYAVSRIQTLRACEYGEYRQNYLAQSFNRFIPVRLILSFYGMEKYNTHHPKAVRGAFLQGAPIAQDIAEGRPGIWPFPLMPLKGDREVPLQDLPSDSVIDASATQFEGDIARVAKLAENRARRYVDTSGVYAPRIAVSPVELLRATQKTLQGLGMSLGTSTEAAFLALQGEMVHGRAYDALMAQIEIAGTLVSTGLTETYHGGEIPTVDLGNAPFVTHAATIADATAGRALADSGRIGSLVIQNSFGFSALDYLVARLAGRGLIAALAWNEADSQSDAGAGIAMAGPAKSSPWMVSILGSPSSVLATASKLVDTAQGSPSSLIEPTELFSRDAGAPASAVLVCVQASNARQDIFDQVSERAGTLAQAKIWSPGTLADALSQRERDGLTINRTHFDALFQMSEGVRIPREQEKLVASE